MKIPKYSKEKLQEKYDAIIIGSGISGLCSAALLCMEGKKVLVLEKHFKIGGYTHTFKRQNYEWDVGIHYVGGVHNPKSMTRRLFDKLSNNNLKWNKMSDNYDRIIFPDKSYNFTAPKSKFIEELSMHFPSESNAIEQYVDLVIKVNKTIFKFFSAKTLSGVSEFFLYKYLSNQFFKYADKTTFDALSELTSNKELIGVLTGQWGDHGLPPKQSSFFMHCAIAGHYFDGGNYPVGGSRMISESIAPQILNNGGDIFMSTGVDKIYTKNNKCCGVVLENGDIIESDFVISSAGIQNTLEKFLRDEDSLKDYRDNLDKVESSFGHGCLYVGFDNSAEVLGIKDTNLWIYPSYDHDLNTETFMNDETSEFPVLYMSFASAKDPSWSKEHGNTATLEAIVPTNFNNYLKWSKETWKKRGTEYEDYKAQFSERIINQIYKHNPHLKDKISYAELSTPLSTRDMAHYKYGELYGANHTPSRFRQKWLKPKTPLKNLYMTGQDITTVGLPSALSSGVLTCSTLLKKNLFKTI